MDPRLSGNSSTNEPEFDCLEVWDQYDDEADNDTMDILSVPSTNHSSEAPPIAQPKPVLEQDGINALSKVVSALRDQSSSSKEGKTDGKVVDQAVNHILQSIQSGLINFSSINSASTERPSATPSQPSLLPTSSQNPPATPDNPPATPRYNPPATTSEGFSHSTVHPSKVAEDGQFTDGDHYSRGRGRGWQGTRGGFSGPRGGGGWEERRGGGGGRWMRGGNSFRGSGWRDPRMGGGWADASGQYFDNAYNRKRGAPTFGMTHSEAKYPRTDGHHDREETDSSAVYLSNYPATNIRPTAMSGRSRDNSYRVSQPNVSDISSWRRRPPCSLTDFISLKKEEAALRSSLMTVTRDLEHVRKLRGALLMMHRDQRDPQVRKCSTIESDIAKHSTDITRQISLEERWLADFRRRQPDADKEAQSVRPVCVFSDDSDHWCRLCSHTAVDLEEFLGHLRSEDHIEAMKDEKPPWKVKKEEKVGEKIDGGPMHGSEFLSQVSGIYCSLCKVFLGDDEETAHHMASQDHEDSFKELMICRPQYLELIQLERYVNTEKKREDIRRNMDRKRMESLVSLHSGSTGSGRIPKKGGAAVEKRAQPDAETEEERKARKAKEKEELRRKEKEEIRKEVEKELRKKREEEKEGKEKEEPKKEKEGKEKEELRWKEEKMKKKKKKIVDSDSDEESLNSVTSSRPRRPSCESSEGQRRRRLSKDSSDRESTEVTKRRRSRESSVEVRKSKKCDEKETEEEKNRLKKRIIESSDDDDGGSSDLDSVRESKKESEAVEEKDDKKEKETEENATSVDEEKREETEYLPTNAKAPAPKTTASMGGESDVDSRGLDLQIVDETADDGDDDGLMVVGEEVDTPPSDEETTEEQEKKEKEEKRMKEEEEKRRKEEEEKEEEEKRKKEEERRRKKEQREKVRREQERREEEAKRARKEERRKERQRQLQEEKERREKKNKPTLEETVEIFRLLSDGKSKGSSTVTPKYHVRPCCVRLQRLNLAKYPHLQRQLEAMSKPPKQRKRGRKEELADEKRPKKGQKLAANDRRRGQVSKRFVDKVDVSSLSSLSSDSDGEESRTKKKRKTRKEESSIKIVKAFSVKELHPEVQVDVGPSCSKIEPATTDDDELMIVSSLDKEDLPINAGVKEEEKSLECLKVEEKTEAIKKEEKKDIVKEEEKTGEKEEIVKEKEKIEEVHEEETTEEKEEVREEIVKEKEKIEEVHEEETTEEKEEVSEEEERLEIVDEEDKTCEAGKTEEMEISEVTEMKSQENGDACDTAKPSTLSLGPLTIPIDAPDPVDKEKSQPEKVSGVAPDDNLLSLDFSSDMEDGTDDFVVAAKKVVENFLKKGRDLSSTESSSSDLSD